MLSKLDKLSLTWVLLKQCIVNILLTKSIKCKHKPFPMVPACTITIHKPQDGTFNKIIYKYLTQQLQQLIYVALSSITSLTVYI